jgi:hypothetical protein
VAHPLPIVSWLLFQSLFTESSHGEHLLAPPPFSGALRAPCPLFCESFSVPGLSFSFCFHFGFLQGRSQSVQGTMLVYPKGGYRSTACCLFAHLLVASPKQVWSQCLVAEEPSWFLSVTWHGEALCWLEVWGVRVLLILGVFFPAMCGSSVSARFLIYRAHAVCFLPLVTIFDPHHLDFNLAFHPPDKPTHTQTLINLRPWPSLQTHLYHSFQ